MKKRIILRLLMILEGLIALFALSCALFYGIASQNNPLLPPSSQTVSAEPVTEQSNSSSAESSETASPETETTAEQDSSSSTADEQPTVTTEETETSSESLSSETETAAVSFDQVVFVGDSRTLSLSSGGQLEYRLVPDDAVCATWGGQLNEQSAHDNAKNAALKGRRKVIFWYGINDVQLNPDRDNPICFIANYDRVIATYLSVNPDSEIFFLSVLDTSVNEKDYYEGQSENIVRYNQALSDYCTEHGYHFIDITALFGEDIFAEGDNIHFSKSWYEEKFLPTVIDQASLYTE